MCKILVVPGIVQENSEKAREFITKMAEEMSSTNSDGLGYAAISRDGQLFSERWLYNKEAFKRRVLVTEQDKDIVDRFKGFISKQERYNKLGNIDIPKATSVILHARAATSDRIFKNTHPFIRDNAALIHNGVIHNHLTFEKKISTCDSEVILTRYLEEQVNVNPEKIKDALRPLSGYYACAVLSFDGNGIPILDIFKDNKASLTAAFIKEFNNCVFSTSGDDIKTVCQKMNLHIVSMYKVEEGKMLRLNAITGETLNTFDFHPGYGYNYNTHGNYHQQGWYTDDDEDDVCATGKNVTSTSKLTKDTKSCWADHEYDHAKGWIKSI